MLPNSHNYESDKKDAARLLFYQMWHLPAYKVLLDMFAEEINRDIIFETTAPREHAEQIAADSTKTIKKTLRFISEQMNEYANTVETMDFSKEERDEAERRTNE